ncbi:MAG TPA: ABC transporter permease [Thermoanaerobaculia bacterium]
MSSIAIIARLEFSVATRQRWVRFFALAFALISIVVAWSAGAVQELSAPEGFAATTVALIPIVLLLVPLAALLLGVSGHAGEPGSGAFLFAQPVSRREVLIGKWLGQVAALTAALGVGLFSGGAFLAACVGFAGAERFCLLVAACVVLGAVFLSIAAALVAAVGKRASALGLAAFIWFLFALLYDGVALGVAGWAPGRVGARILFGSVFGNPSDLVRVLTLSVAGTPHILGAAGEAWSRFLGGAAGAVLFSAAALTAWVAVPLYAARHALERRDL